MFKIEELICLLYLGILSVQDLRRREISIGLLILGGVVGGLIRMIETQGISTTMIGGIAIGIGFLIVSKVTREQFGYGDSLLILVLGIYMGLWKLATLLISAFLISALFAVIVLGVKGFQRKSSYPFVPFLLLAYILGQSIWSV